MFANSQAGQDFSGRLLPLRMHFISNMLPKVTCFFIKPAFYYREKTGYLELFTIAHKNK